MLLQMKGAPTKKLIHLCRPVSSHRLVPGDVVVLLRGKATCDMVLLQGSCLVEESMLSGEVKQVSKLTLPAVTQLSANWPKSTL